MKYRNLTTKLIILASCIAMTACGGANSSSTTNSSTTRQLTGSLTSNTGSSLMKYQTLSSCLADKIIATNPSGITSTSDVGTDCSFDINLTIGSSYIISFTLSDEFVATLIFNSGVTGLSGTSFGTTTGSGAVTLGNILISGNTAVAQNNPLGFMDQDGDGLSDFDDSDDDGDGTEDSDEGDCDFDGFSDDDDDDDDSCDSNDDQTEARALRVKPYNGETDVDLDKRPKIYTACALDQSSITATSFTVTSDTRESISCSYQFSDSTESGTSVRCNHNDLEADTEYTVTLLGALCQDGSEINTVSWSFTTELEDDDDGDAEDSIDLDDPFGDNSGSSTGSSSGSNDDDDSSDDSSSSDDDSSDNSDSTSV